MTANEKDHDVPMDNKIHDLQDDDMQNINEAYYKLLNCTRGSSFHYKLICVLRAKNVSFHLQSRELKRLLSFF